MGGKNHQPCRIYLLNSTRLSRALSLAYAHLELGNAVLENILIGELDASHTPEVALMFYSQVNSELCTSVQELQMAQQTIADMYQQMVDTGFADLPTLGKIDLTGLGTNLAVHGMVNLASWQDIQRVMQNGGFYAVLENFDTKVSSLIELTEILHLKFKPLESSIANGSLTDIVEENQPESFKPEFAAVYAAWTELNGLFLASSLMSTELWYAFTGKRSLAPNHIQLRSA